ncbi:hypothetical protein Poli38472_013553 [Pythium oligandrum]|uniref:Uncharacterized protein n=1 Tax=Pythium oligandrum TaxID=41045 RepID=A0A8K1FEL8_PYTOL|nr:hypothetical protein Poli38472_013553 [Pythium oligandrum]|eukprot:TMW58079.1 hypothetical protein Poli38472_013553 [Pythium oligandrum]
MTATTCDSASSSSVYDPSLYDSLESYVEQMNAQLEGKSAVEIVEWAVATFGVDHTALSTSFGIQSAVMLNLVSSIDNRVPVVWIDTGYLPRETYQFATRLTKEMSLNMKVYQSPISPARMEALYGKLWEIPTVEAHKQYGYIRKVEPMQRALRELNTKALLVGVRAEQTANREGMKVVNVYEGRVKICPIIKWTKKDVEEYMAANNLSYHPLKAQGYETVGDAHSSRPVSAEDGNERSSRFHGVAQECGLHIDMKDVKLEDFAITLDDPAALTEREQDILAKTKQSKGIVIITKPNCKYCRATKELFQERGWDYEDFTVGEDVSTQSVQVIVGQPVKTVPQIFLDGKYIGGYTELCVHLDIPSRFA